jgi:hypothetical protein
MKPKEDLPLIDLSRWNLTIPIGAEVIPTSKLNRGYQDPFFKPQPDFGFIDFIAPSDVRGAASTPNSDYPRCELRGTLLNGDDKESNWKIASAALHILAGRCAIMEGARSGKLIFTQWHGDGNHPGFKGQGTRQKNGKWNLYAQLRRELNGAEDKVLIAENVAEGDAFDYRFELTGSGLFKVFVNGAQVVTGPLLKDGYQFDMKSYAKDTWYPKAGVYSQEKVGGQGRGWVRYFALHAFDGEAANAPTFGLPAQAPVVQPAPTTPGERVLADLARAVAEILAKVRAGTLAVAEALATIQALKVEADTKFAKSKERSDLYTQIVEVREAIRKPVEPPTPAEPEVPEVPTAPAEPEPTTPEPANDGEGIKAKLSEMEDLLDQIPETAAEPLRHLIDDVRRLVA